MRTVKQKLTSVDYRILCNNAKFGGVGLNDLELYSAHPSTDQERVAFTYRTIGFEEIWLQVDLKNVSTQSLDRVIKGENVDAFPVLNVMAGLDVTQIAQFHAKVVAGHLYAKGLEGEHVNSSE